MLKRVTIPGFDTETEVITTFHMGNKFKKYFEEIQLPKQLEKYYRKYKYQFEIPERGLKQIGQLLEEYY
jgi:hypothetical protein